MKTPASKIRLLLVDDSRVATAMLSGILRDAPDIEVVGTARDGKEALSLVQTLDPAVVCTDLHMPVMDGLELTKRIMANHPRPILVVSASVEEGAVSTFQLLEAGAIDVVLKPRVIGESDYRAIRSELIGKIRILSGVRVVRRMPGRGPAADAPVLPGRRVPAGIIVIGASTGGPQALHAILPSLPADLPVPVVCVQHISCGFLEGMVRWLAPMCSLTVRIAREGDFAKAGAIYFPQEGKHLEFDDGGRFVFSPGSATDRHCPSVDVTMRSAAKTYRDGAVAVLLSGMGIDGADGMLKVSRAGGVTIAQDEESCVVFGMPKKAIELGAASIVSPLPGIAAALIGSCRV